MPRIKVNNGVAVHANPDYQATAKILVAMKIAWQEQMKLAELDPMKFSQLSVVALSQLGAIIAVDVGMSLEQFISVCGANFNAAYMRAPKFGD